MHELSLLPNFLLDEVPEGGVAANCVVRAWGAPPSFSFAPKPHWELGEKLGILDLPAGARLAGSGFPVLRGMGAKLVRSLANFMLDLHVREHGYLEVAPPYVVNYDSMFGTGQMPKFAEELYQVRDDGLFLIPTAEVPVTNIHRGAVLDGADLPLAYVAWTPCFRREAGAHGKDTRGLIRVHQFDKVELVRFCRPEDSEAQHELITRHAEAVLQRLELPYRVVDLAAGDTGHTSAHTFDLEVWAAGVGAWLEVSSASTFTDYQARRANIRYRPEPGAGPRFVHTLNASGVAFPRCLIALLENGQQADGSIRLPDVLVPYVGVSRIDPAS
jgi:seryl-tRNA synthetase